MGKSYLSRPLLTAVCALALASCGTTVQGQVAPPGAFGERQAVDGGVAAPSVEGGQLDGGSASVAPGGRDGSPEPGEADGRSQQGTPKPATGAQTPPRAGVGPEGSAVGITTKTISIGIITADGYSKAAGSFGASINTGNMRAQAQSIVDHLNARGGLAGRKIIPVFYDVNLARAISDPASEQQAACAAFTQDSKVYAVATVFAFLNESFYECLRRAGVITSAAGEAFDQDFFVRFANDFYMPVEMNMTRIMKNNVIALNTAGFFRGWNPSAGSSGPNPVKIGLVRFDTPSDVRVRDQGVKPALASQGLSLADEQAVSATDTGRMTSQYQSAVLRFASQGITHVLYTFASPLVFMQQANSQRYYPRYALHSRSSPAALLQGNAPREQLRGSMGLGWQQYNDVDTSHDPGPPSSRGRLCLQLLKQAGQDTNVRATALVGLWYCDTLFFLRDALASAPSFSHVGFRSGAESLSRFEAAGTFRSSFAPGLPHDGVRAYRLFAFDDSCSCFSYRTDVRAAS